MSIRVVEVGPRDGLQLEPIVLDVSIRCELIDRLRGAGLLEIEAASFVNERLVPQMAGASSLVEAVPAVEGATVYALVLNERGALRALESSVRHMRFVVAATDSFNRRNQNASVSESLEHFGRSVAACAGEGVPCSAVIAVSFGCPLEGTVPPGIVTDLAAELVGAGAQEITLADTIGVAVPSLVEELFEQVRQVVGETGVGGHFHDTRNTGIANAVAALRSGATHLDSSIGGLGGCPFAPGATGNVATEDLVYCLESMGVRTGVDLRALLGVVSWLGAELGRPIGGATFRAGIPRFLDTWGGGNAESFGTTSTKSAREREEEQ